MYNNSKVAKAVRIAMMFGAGAAAAISAPAFSAEEESAQVIEKIEVTGSRIKRTDLEGASPVTILSIEDMKIEGNFTVADALRGSSFNSFGSFSERSGSSAQSQATLNLRGAGSNRTLVLLDGKRMPGSPTLGGQSANLNSIPMAAVERIEILTDGASSTYGSDAIAGVVNIIMKKNYEGLEFTVGAGQRDRDEGTTSSEFSITGGFSTDKGNITFAFDHQKRKGISDGARNFTRARAEDLNGDGNIEIYTGETDGYSYYGANVAAPDFSVMKAATSCDDLIAEGQPFKRMAMNEGWGPGSDVCAYPYADVSYNKASINRNTLFVDANYEVADGVEWFGRAMFVQNSSFGRYAPPAATWDDMSFNNSENPYGVSDDGAGFANPATPGLAWSPMFTDANGDSQYYNYDADGSSTFTEDADGVKTYDAGVYDADQAYQTTTGYYRWVGIGNRDGDVDDYNQDYLTGFRGDLDWNNASWEVYYHRNNADNKSVGQFYLSKGGLAHNQANGIDLGSEDGVANLKATTLQSSSSSFDQYYAGIGLDMFELPGGEMAHYFGMEYQEITFADIYDGQSEAGLIGGSAGNSARGERDITAFFYEGAMPITDDIEVNIAVRYDDYSDFGDNIAPKISLRWQLMDSLVLRASYSEAFRAPGLDELNAADTFSAETAIDYASGSSSSVQYDTWYKSNADLGPETSEYTNLGLAWDITDSMGFKVDYFNLAIDDVIQTKTVQALLDDEAKGTLTAIAPGETTSATFYLVRASGPGSKLLEASTGYYNGIGFDIEGVDIAFNSKFETSFGDISFNVINSFTLAYEEERGGNIVDTAGWSAQPDFKSVATLGWSMENHSFAWNANYTDSTSEFEEPTDTGFDVSGELDSWLIHNVTYTYHTDDYGSVMFTVSNLTDEDPVLSTAGTYDSPSLYNNLGRDYRVSYTLSF
jgi:iron complex outermembrane receptor protein